MNHIETLQAIRAHVGVTPDLIFRDQRQEWLDAIDYAISRLADDKRQEEMPWTSTSRG